MKKFGGMSLVVVLFLMYAGSSFAVVNDCQAIFIDIKKRVNYRVAGSCAGDTNLANANAEALCRKFANDPSDCMPGQMSFKGVGYYNLSVCTANESIAMACTYRNDRLHCRVGCGDTQDSADSKAIDDCMDIHYLNKMGCMLQTVDY